MERRPGYESTLAAAETSRRALGVDVIDLYLIHWAMPARGRYLDTWRAFIELRERGTVRSIGVSNFPVDPLDEIITVTGVTPAVHQVELHPYFNQQQLRDVNADRGIRTESWSPLGQGGDELADPVIAGIAAAHGATAAQVIIAWQLALGNVVIPKSVTPNRIVENFAAHRLHLSEDDVASITALERGGRLGADPAQANHLVPPRRD